MVTRKKTTLTLGHTWTHNVLQQLTKNLDHLKQSAACVVYGHIAWKAVVCTQGSHKLNTWLAHGNTQPCGDLSTKIPEPRANQINSTDCTWQSFPSTRVVLIVLESSMNVYTFLRWEPCQLFMNLEILEWAVWYTYALCCPPSRYLELVVTQVMIWHGWLVNDQQSRNSPFEKG